MKQRNPFAVLFLSLITFGIYDLYWLVKTKTVLNNKTKIHTPTIFILFIPVVVVMILAIVLALALPHNFMSSGTTTQTLSNGQPALSTAPNAGSAAFILLLEFICIIVIIPVTFYWFFKFSKAIGEYTDGELNTGVTFLLLWLLHFIGIIIVQDKFNDMIAAGRDGGGQIPVPAVGEAVALPQALADQAVSPPPADPNPDVVPQATEIPQAPMVPNDSVPSDDDQTAVPPSSEDVMAPQAAGPPPADPWQAPKPDSADSAPQSEASESPPSPDGPVQANDVHTPKLELAENHHHEPAAESDNSDNQDSQQ